jgi:hypothetical protein
MLWEGGPVCFCLCSLRFPCSALPRTFPHLGGRHSQHQRAVAATASVVHQRLIVSRLLHLGEVALEVGSTLHIPAYALHVYCHLPAIARLKPFGG